jgi:hypothetical protein
MKAAARKGGGFLFTLKIVLNFSQLLRSFLWQTIYHADTAGTQKLFIYAHKMLMSREYQLKGTLLVSRTVTVMNRATQNLPEDLLKEPTRTSTSERWQDVVMYWGAKTNPRAPKVRGDFSFFNGNSSVIKIFQILPQY